MDRQHKKNKRLELWISAFLWRFSFARILEKLKSLKLLPKEDGWRTATQAYLRREHTKFVLAAFRLDFWSDVPFQKDRNSFSPKNISTKDWCCSLNTIRSPTASCSGVNFRHKGRRKGPQDIVCADFNNDGTLKSIRPCLDQSRTGLSVFMKRARSDWMISWSGL